MFLIYLKKILVFFTLFFFFTAFFGVQAGAQNSVKQCVKVLVGKYIETIEDEEGETTSYLSIKDDCKQHKAEAANCCNNPNACSGLMRDLIENTLPLAPALYGAFKSYKISKSAKSDGITPEESATKMCNAKNTAAMGAFAGQLLLQLGSHFKKTCSDRIKQCVNKCNTEIHNFREEFKNCFNFSRAIIPPNSGIESIISFAKKCNEFRDEGDEDEDADAVIDIDAANRYSMNCGSNEGESESESDVACSSVNDDSSTCCPKTNADCTFANGVNEKTIGHILLFATAYKNSVLRPNYAKSLSEKSNEEEIVKCSDQPDRVVTERKGAKGPVPAPMIDLCEQLVRSHPESPLPLSPQQPHATHPGSLVQGSDGTSALAGGSPVNPLLSQSEEEEYGAVDVSEDIPDPYNKPPLSSKVPGWSSSSGPTGGGGGSSGGGPGGGGGAPGVSSDDGEGSDYPYRSSAFMGGGDSFSGGESYAPTAGGSEQRALYARGKNDKSTNKEKNVLGEKFKLEDDSQNKGESIFQIASRRIQQFCSNDTCSK